MEKIETNLQKSPRITPRAIDDNNLEVFHGDLENKMTSLVLWINGKVKRKQWSNEEIAAKFTKRNTVEILADGDTGYMNACSDLTLVAWTLLKKNGFKPVLVVEKLTRERYDFTGMHFALEFSDKGVPYFLEFVTQNQVLLRKGEYTHKKEGIKTIEIKRIRTDIRPDQNMQSVLEGQIDITDVKIEKIIAQLQKDNTAETYSGYISRMSHEGNLYLDSDTK